MVPGVGIEPTTRSSSGFRSTTELPRRYFKDHKYILCMVPVCTFLSIKMRIITTNSGYSVKLPTISFFVILNIYKKLALKEWKHT